MMVSEVTASTPEAMNQVHRDSTACWTSPRRRTLHLLFSHPTPLGLFCIMPALKARDSSESSGPNLGLILAIVVSALVLIVVLVALFLPIYKQRRNSRNQPPPSTLEQFMNKAERERIREKSYPGHRNSDSMGPLLDEQTNWSQAGRQLRVNSVYIPPLPDNVRDFHGGDDDEDHDLGPQMQTGPIQYTRDPMRSPPLRLSIPQTAPIPTSNWAYQPHESPASAGSTESSQSMYSERTASTARMHTIDLTSPPPPVPPLPEHLQSQNQSPWRPHGLLPPDEPQLARGDTVVVARLLKSRAKRLAGTPERSVTRTSRIERADSIREIVRTPSPPDDQRLRPPPLPLPSDAEAAFADTLAYYTSQPIDSDSPVRSPDGTISASSYNTETPPLRVTRSTKSAV
ncbi:hypothetical protein B0H10DRAFT_1984374 [Mycena sp. CBHHK59/15]|nr:hypothetical protein B0H10DRAFT_1984374 [Mycena sp. CBHHK59/15]